MLFLLRKIRRKMIENKNITSYLLYATGEILLVMIGLLGAFQIDEWKDDRKQKKQVVSFLKSLKKEIASDTLVITKELKISFEEYNHSNNILKRIKSKNATLDSIVHIAKEEFIPNWVSHIDYSRTTYDNMRSSDIFEIMPDSIKNNITAFYNTQEYWLQIADKVYFQYQARFNDYTTRYAFKAALNKENTYLYNSVWENIDPSHFNPRFLFLVQSRAIMWREYCKELENVLKKSRVLLHTIDKQLK